MESPSAQGTNLFDLVYFLLPGRTAKSLGKLPEWPPDVFAVAGYILHKTGAYKASLNDGFWANSSNPNISTLKGLGEQWRANLGGDKAAPSEIRKYWQEIQKNYSVTLTAMRADWESASYRTLILALLNLVIIADEATVGMGLPTANLAPGHADNKVQRRAALALQNSIDRMGMSTLCEEVTPSVLCVLPRIHTPQVGFTFRSLSHHIALWPSDEISPVWFADVSSKLARREVGMMNILLVPHPARISADQFNAVEGKHAGGHIMHSKFTRFTFQVMSNQQWLMEEFPCIIRRAINESPDHRLDGVILPELSLLGDEEFATACQVVNEQAPGAFLVAGVCVQRGDDMVNVSSTMCPVSDNGGGWLFSNSQQKHHRWLLDSNQVKSYNINKNLYQLDSFFWENTPLGKREIHFFPIKHTFTMCVLVCEDLARQEPASRLVRTVGPQLVVALLMDGPQFDGRWASRYAAVLAEDPGSSVLTLTSKGMALLDKRPKRDCKKGESCGRVKCDAPDCPATLGTGICIGLWRDAKSGSPLELHMDPKAQALLISPTLKGENQFTADGRECYKNRLLLDKSKPGLIKNIFLDL